MCGCGGGHRHGGCCGGDRGCGEGRRGYSYGYVGGGMGRRDVSEDLQEYKQGLEAEIRRLEQRIDALRVKIPST